jgi:hypothetical protein
MLSNAEWQLEWQANDEKHHSAACSQFVQMHQI